MARSIAFATLSLACAITIVVTGNLQVWLLLGSVLTAIELGFKGSVRWGCSVTGLVLGYYLMLGSEGQVASLLPGLFLLLARLPFAATEVKPAPWNWLVIFPLAYTCYSWPDRDVASLSFVLLATQLPIPRADVAPPTRALLFKVNLTILAATILYIAYSAYVFFDCPVGGRTALLRMGDWAKTDVSVENLADVRGMESLYSYSEMLGILGATAISVDGLDEGVSECWVFTPTVPPTPEHKKKIESWVARGGHLIVVTDHTDLFGHGRVVNSLVSGFGLYTSFSAFFPEAADGAAYIDGVGRTWFKTSNCESGLALLPLVTARWVDEEADYSGDNFFGPMQPNRTTRFGRRTIVGSKAFGQGNVTMLGDSTIFANFAVYQPGVSQLISQVRRRALGPKLLPCFTISFLLLSAIAALSSESATLFVLPLLAPWLLITVPGAPLAYRCDVLWSGDPALVREWTSPEVSISTIYALQPWLGLRPYWCDEPPDDRECVWVSQVPPPRAGWVWLRPEVASSGGTSSSSRWLAVTRELNRQPPLPLPPTLSGKYISYCGVWANSAVGDWWIEGRLSRSKLQRILAWKGAVLGNYRLPDNEKFPEIVGDTRLFLRSEWRDAIGDVVVRGPDFTALSEGTEIYLGNGVSGRIVKTSQGLVLMGGQSMTEGWFCARNWILKPLPISSNDPGSAPILPP